MGFDFEGTYTRIVVNEYDFGDRHAVVDFIPQGQDVTVRVNFDPETEHSLDQQREGWLAILQNFTSHADPVQPDRVCMTVC
nr:hypothetical protein [Paracoccus beibuensis]